ncbi:uncharacterized protein LOC111066901 [Drosophila obscura]|uniref:uncharacterized protein LOC111066901 n=1 Tax=Drosophila obscura TaxID=7282 RepID=UPI001BB267EF|nr:uncharacterized protein LOC111066901 [Drosophila obscura]
MGITFTIYQGIRVHQRGYLKLHLHLQHTSPARWLATADTLFGAQPQFCRIQLTPCQQYLHNVQIKKMQLLSINFFLFFALSNREWAETAQQMAASKESDGFTTPSPAWIEYQRIRFSQGPGDPNILTSSQILGSSTQAPVPAVVVVTPKVETTSRRHSSHSTENHLEEETTEPPVDSGDGENDSDIEMPGMHGFLKFLKSMQNSWIKKSALSIEKKIKLLQNLRDNLMLMIEQHFAVLWQPTERKRRRRRGLMDEAAIDFPPETAILSINFLTFAVFLIKLVMQVVKIVKSKHYTLSGFSFNPQVIRNP